MLQNLLALFDVVVLSFSSRIVQLTVTNNLVGRIIGRGGSKINAIQVSSGAHINVSRNIPRSTERLITIKVRS